MKIMPPLKNGAEDRVSNIESNFNVKTCNNMSGFAWDVDYQYYIEEANKLIQPFETILFT